MTTALRTSRFTRHFVVPVTLLALLSGCYKWSTPSQSPADFIREEEPSQVKLHPMDGRELEVHDPAVTDGDISFFVNDTLRTVRRDEVFYLEHRKTSTLAIAGLATLVGLLALTAAMASSGDFFGDG